MGGGGRRGQGETWERFSHTESGYWRVFLGDVVGTESRKRNEMQGRRREGGKGSSSCDASAELGSLSRANNRNAMHGKAP